MDKNINMIIVVHLTATQMQQNILLYITYSESNPSS